MAVIFENQFIFNFLLFDTNSHFQKNFFFGGGPSFQPIFSLLQRSQKDNKNLAVIS